ncbi:MAG TPA: hypothetical protein VHF05_01775 [Candidatus Paceibacterota bacterium]|nr:hypothetical protein [Candidatus Paceibacterota bacterium]
MKRTIAITASLVAVFAFAISFGAANHAFADEATSSDATSTDTEATTSPFSVRIMEHVCPDITSVDQFNEMESGLGTKDGFLAAEKACSTTALPGDSPVADAISGPRATFDYEVTSTISSSSDEASTSTLSISDAAYKTGTLCESDVNEDLNDDGDVATSTCLDASYYDFPIDFGENGTTTTTTAPVVTLRETELPDDTSYGGILFTPASIMENTDADTYISSSSTESATSSPVVTLDLSRDSDGDNAVMLHIFHFANASTSTTTGSSTDDNGGDNGNSDNGNGTSTPDLGPIWNALNSRLDDIQSRLSDNFSNLQSRLSDLQDRLSSIFKGDRIVNNGTMNLDDNSSIDR